MKRTDEQIKNLILKVMEQAGEPMTEDEIGAVIDWIGQAETDRAILKLFEEGKVSLRWQEDDLQVKLCRRDDL